MLLANINEKAENLCKKLKIYVKSRKFMLKDFFFYVTSKNLC